MSDPRSNFIELAVQGEAPLEAIDDFIDEWHEGGGAKPIHDFLGMTFEEYARWVSDADALNAIVEARRETSSAPSLR